jgi:thiosulfate/3-mercaptopyruvate sulfurtransferase
MPHTHYTTLISAANLAERLTAAPGSVFVIDCRFDLADTEAGEKAYAAAHLPGAQYLHLDRDLSSPKTGTNGRHPLPDRAKLAAMLAARGLKQGQQVVAYDAQGGMYAARAWWLLRWLGHDAVALLDGGLQAWQAAGHPLTQEVAPHSPGNFKAGAPLAVTFDVQAVERNLSTHERVVIDARAADRYRGENETLDRVGGHIPGALNRFFKGAFVTRRIPGIVAGHRAGSRGAAVRLRSNGLRQRAGDGSRRPAWRRALRRVVERVDVQSGQAGCDRAESVTVAGGPTVLPAASIR